MPSGLVQTGSQAKVTLRNWTAPLQDAGGSAFLDCAAPPVSVGLGSAMMGWRPMMANMRAAAALPAGAEQLL